MPVPYYAAIRSVEQADLRHQRQSVMARGGTAMQPGFTSVLKHCCTCFSRQPAFRQATGFVELNVQLISRSARSAPSDTLSVTALSYKSASRSGQNYSSARAAVCAEKALFKHHSSTRPPTSLTARRRLHLRTCRFICINVSVASGF